MFKNGLVRYWPELLLGAGVLIGSFIYHQKLAAAATEAERAVYSVTQHDVAVARAAGRTQMAERLAAQVRKR